MSPTYSSFFYDALTCAVRTALAKYPEDAKILRRAADLVLDGHVQLMQLEAMVQSGSSPDVQYLVNGRCECQGYQYSTTGRCAHRWAVALQRRALGQDLWQDGAHSIERRDAEAATGTNLAALVCLPEWRQARELSGQAVTPDGRAGMAQRS